MATSQVASNSFDPEPTVPDLGNGQFEHSLSHQEQGSPLKTTIIPRPNYVPPLNFSLVEDGIYRSGFPMPINYPFMKQLKLKTIIYVGDLCHEKAKKKGRDEKPKKDKNGTAEIYEKYKAWIESTDINFHPLLVHSSQEPFTLIETQAQTQESLRAALHLILDKRNFPILIHHP